MGATEEVKTEEILRSREQKQRDLDESEREARQSHVHVRMLASLQVSQDDKSLNSLFPATVCVKNIYTMCD